MNDVTSMSIITSAKIGVMRGVEGEVFGCSVLSSQPLYKSKTVSKVKVYCVGQVWRYTLIIPEPRKVEKGGSGVQGHFQPQSKVEATLGYTGPFLNITKNKRLTFQCLSSYVCVFIYFI